MTLSPRDQKILDAVLAGRHAPLRWARVSCGRVELQVSTDVLTIGGVRVGVSPPLAQALADALECVLPTPRIADAIYEQATARLAAHPQDVTDPHAEALHTRAIDRELAGQHAGELISDCGKHWVLCRSVLAAGGARAANYGWHYPWAGSGLSPAASNGLPGVAPSWVIQPTPLGGASIAHNYAHWDYSQTFRAVRRACLYDGAPADLAELLVDPARAGEVSREGALAAARLPGLPPLEQRAPVPPEPPPAATPAVGDDPSVSVFVQARGFTRAARGTPSARYPVLWVVLHSVEGALDEPRGGEALAVVRWFGGPSAPQASTHYAVDPTTVAQGVLERDVAWAAPGANERGIQIEHAGRAMRTDWLAGPGGRAVLERSARLTAGICRRWSIPVQEVRAEGLLAGTPGITCHSWATDAAHDATRLPAAGRTEIQRRFAEVAAFSNHQDPGGPGARRWPMSEYLRLVRAAI